MYIKTLKIMPKSYLLKSLFILFVCFISCFIGFIIAGFFASKYTKAKQAATYFKASEEWFEFGTPLKKINGKCITDMETMNIFDEKETPPYLTHQY